MKTKVLNLYAGIGGNRKLWDNVEVTAIELEPKIASAYRELHPYDEVIEADAHEFLLQNYDKFDFIWSSPPCPTHSKMMKATRHKLRKYPDMSLYQEVIFLKHFCKNNWVVENVKPYYEPLIDPSKSLGRHLFWSNFHISDYEIKNHANFINTGTVSDSEPLKD